MAEVQLVKKTKGPRAYVTVRDPAGGATICFTAKGITAKQFVQRLEKVFGSFIQSSHGRRRNPSAEPASTEPLPATANATAGA